MSSNSSSNCEVAGSTSGQDVTTRTTLPAELIFEIFDHVVPFGRDTDLAWTVSLTLVSHDVRAYLMPIVFEILRIDVPWGANDHYIGWDGREYRHCILSFLSWLINTPEAAPRRHIKHIIFTFVGPLMAEDLTATAPCSYALWSVERMTVSMRHYGRLFEDAGLHVESMYSAAPQMKLRLNVTLEPYLTIARHGHFGACTWQGSSFLRCWHTTWNGPGTDAMVEGLNYYELDPQNRYEEKIVPDDPQGHFIIIEFRNGDLRDTTAAQVVDDIRNIMSQRPAQNIVLAYKKDDQVSVQQVREIIGVTEKRLARRSKLRVWVTYKLWDRELSVRDPLLAHARALQEGLSTWDVGSRVWPSVAEE